MIFKNILRHNKQAETNYTYKYAYFFTYGNTEGIFPNPIFLIRTECSRVSKIHTLLKIQTAELLNNAEH